MSWRSQQTPVVNQRSLALGSLVGIVMAAMVLMLLSLSPGVQWPLAVLALTAVVALMSVTLRVRTGERDAQNRREVELFSGPAADDAEESWSVDDEDLPDVNEGDLSGVWSGTVRFGGGCVGGKKLIKDLAYEDAVAGDVRRIGESIGRGSALAGVADECSIVPLRVALSEYPARVRLLPSEQFLGKNRVVAVEVVEHDAVYAALHLRVSLSRVGEARATLFDVSLTYGGRRAPTLTPMDETATYVVELRRTHHFRMGLDGRRLSGVSLLSASLSQLHPLAR